MKRSSAGAARKEQPEAGPAPVLPEVEQMISVATLAERLGVSRGTIYGEMDAGRFPYYRIGGTRRIAESDAAAYVASRRVGPPRK